MTECARRGCRREAVVAYDVWSWWRDVRKQTPRHYEVCAKHEHYFTGRFTSDESERVKRDLVALDARSGDG